MSIFSGNRIITAFNGQLSILSISSLWRK